MKHIKKNLPLILMMIALVMSFGAAAFAENGPAAPAYSITITNDNRSMSIVGKTYSAYKLFDVSYSETSYAYSIKTDNPFYSNAAAKAVLDIYFDFYNTSDPTEKAVTVKPSKQDASTKTLSAGDVRALADALQPYITEPPAGSATAGEPTATNPRETVTIHLAEAGYYIVTGTVKPTYPRASTSEVVSAVILDNATPTATVKPKATVPTLRKRITNVTEGTVIDGYIINDVTYFAERVAVAQVGSTVSYELKSEAPDLTGYNDYTFTFGDEITAGLDYVRNSFKLKVGNGAAAGITPEFADDGKSFTYTIPFATLQTYTKGAAIFLTYDCTINAGALTTNYEKNTADLTYSHSPYDKTTNTTPKDETFVIDLNIDLDKIDGKDSDKHLEGAEFKLFRYVSAATPDDPADPAPGETAPAAKEYYKWDTVNGKVTWVAEAQADVFITGTDGKLTQQVRGLDRGDFYLEEIKAPAGYNKLKDPVYVKINTDGHQEGETIEYLKTQYVTYRATYNDEPSTVLNATITMTEAQKNNAQPVATGTILNEAGAELPSTGGSGATIFYVVGSILTVIAGVLLITVKRMSRAG